MRPGLVPGVNVDRVDVDCGMAQAGKLGYADPNELMVIEYALQRWQRGEEDGAEATIRSHRIDYTSWRVILASAVASAASSGYRAVPLNRLGYPAYQAGKVYGGVRTALAPADALWQRLKQLAVILASDDPARQVTPSGRVVKLTRFDLGRLHGEAQAAGEALAMILLGHDMTFGDAAEVLQRAALAEARQAEPAAPGGPDSRQEAD